MVTSEDTKSKPKSAVVKIPDDEVGRANDAFQKTEDRHVEAARSQRESSVVHSQDDSRDDREFRGDQEPRERAQNFENGRVLRDSKRYRETDIAPESDRRFDESRIMYKSRDIYQRPIDEIDTPRFPMEHEKGDPLFAKIVNPSVKIMRIERDVEEALDSYRWFLVSTRNPSRHPGSEIFI